MSIKDLFAELFSPDSCCICDEIIRGFTDSRKILFHTKKSSFESPFCDHCTSRLEKSFIPHIRKIRQSPALAISLFDFSDETVRNALMHLKSTGCTACRRFFARVAAEFVCELSSGSKDYYLTFIPRSRMLYEKFGFDQSEEVSRTCVRYSDSLHYEKLLCRDKHVGYPQKTLGWRGRFENAEKSLKLKKDPPDAELIIVLDDMITTGATALATYRLLARESSAEIRFLFLAGSTNIRERRNDHE